jgi:hypothetical protein
VHTSRSVGKSGTGSQFVLSGQAWTRPEENFGGALGVTLYTVNYLAGDSLRTIRPSIAAWARIFDLVKFTGRLSSGVDRFGIWESYGDNPLLSLGTPVHGAFRSVDVDVNAEVSLTHSNVATLGLANLIVKDYPIWVRKDTNAVWDPRFPNDPFVPDQFALDYTYQEKEMASITSVYGRYQHWWTHGSFDLLAIWRAHALRGRPVPHVPDWECHLVTSFAAGRGIVLSPAVHAVGPRSFVLPNSLNILGRLGPYVVLDAEAAVPLKYGWQLAVSAENLLNQRYEKWEGFREPGLHLQVGVKRAW